jgi:hypothetical protein
VELVPVSFENLESLDDGRQAAAFKRHMARVAQDCIDRPGDSTARVITLKLSIKPVIGQDGQCERCFMEMEQKSSIPVYRSRPFEMDVTKGGLRFNKDFPDTIDQPPLFPSETDSEES